MSYHWVNEAVQKVSRGSTLGPSRTSDCVMQQSCGAQIIQTSCAVGQCKSCLSPHRQLHPRGHSHGRTNAGVEKRAGREQSLVYKILSLQATHSGSRQLRGRRCLQIRMPSSCAASARRRCQHSLTSRTANCEGRRESDCHGVKPSRDGDQRRGRNGHLLVVRARRELVSLSNTW